jgi:hypothetical protein
MNKITRRVLCFLLCVGVFVGSLSGGTRTSPRSSQALQAGQAGDVVPGVVIVKFKRGFTAPSGALQKGTNAVLEAMRTPPPAKLTCRRFTLRQSTGISIRAPSPGSSARCRKWNTLSQNMSTTSATYQTMRTTLQTSNSTSTG